MNVAERRAARLEGWRRAFCLNDRRMRGCPSTPGLMMSLDRGGTCAGVVLRMDAGVDAHAVLVDLLQKEPPVPPERVMAETDAGPVQAIVFAAHPDFPLYRPKADLRLKSPLLRCGPSNLPFAATAKSMTRRTGDQGTNCEFAAGSTRRTY